MKEVIQALIARLAVFNEWRRFDGDGESPAMPNPKQIGEDIDAAIRILSAVSPPMTLRVDSEKGVGDA
jgi:hypothetical protein